MKLQIVSATPKAGISKAQKPYSMLIIDGIFTDDDGVVKTCEMSFFIEAGRPAPKVVVGQCYEPVIKVGVSRDRKLTAYIDNLLPVASLQKAA